MRELVVGFKTQVQHLSRFGLGDGRPVAGNILLHNAVSVINTSVSFEFVVASCHPATSQDERRRPKHGDIPRGDAG